MGPPSPSRPPRPGRPRRGHAFPARGRWGGATAGGRGRRSARPGWLAGWRGGREGESEWQGASTGGRGRQGAGLLAVPCAFESPRAAAARRRAGSLSCKIWETSPHTARSLLSSRFLPSFHFPLSFTSLPFFSQVYLTGAGGFSLRDALAAARNTQ